VVAALAAAFAVRRLYVRFAAGARGRDNLVDLDGDPDTLGTRLAELLRDG
jgi:hypothetical protein